jgi:type IX secretion system PorP/SprF family membrane protein
MKIRFTILLLLLSCGLKAQQDAQSSMYFFNPLNFNPAYAGSRGCANITSVGRAQWLGWEGAPKTQFLSVHAPVMRQKIGLGGNLNMDKIGSRSAINANAIFAYHMQLNDEGLKLSLGATAGIHRHQHNFRGLTVTDNSDPNYLLANTSVNSNFGFGTYLYHHNYYAGISMPRLINTSLDNNTGNSILQRHLFVMAGYVHTLNSVIDIKPSILFKYTADSPPSADLNLSAHFYQKIWVGLLYRMHDAVGFNASFQVKDNMMIGYAYDFPLNRKMIRQTGGHEFVISFDLCSKNSAYYSPRYF